MHLKTKQKVMFSHNYSWLFFSVILLSIASFSCKDRLPSSYIGKYSSHMPRVGPLITFQESKHNGKIVPMWVMMISLRADSTFVMGSCDLQIWEAGDFTLRKDSILLYNIYSFKEDNPIENKTCFFDKKTSSIYYRYPNTHESSSNKYPESIAILELDFLRGHRGFLRNESWSLDSLYKFNTFLPYDEQSQWADSVLNTRRN